MAKPPITQARDVDAELVLQLNKFGSAADLRSQQAKLTGAAREIRKLTGGGTDLFGKLGCYLSFEQKQAPTRRCALARLGEPAGRACEGKA